MSQETFLIRLGDLPDAVTECIKTETNHYTVPIVINDIPLGSGTLVEIDGFYGILTAEHVVRHPDRPDLHLDNTSHDGPKLLVPPPEYPGGSPIESFALRVLKTSRSEDSYGPDLALIILPASPLLSHLRARRSFYPLAKDIGGKVQKALLDTGFVAFCGFPASTQFDQSASHGFDEVKELRGFAFITGPEKYEEKEPWDYFELGVSRSEMGEVGVSFGGVSGGGVWRAEVYRKKEDPVGKEIMGEITLSGVAFYEENHLPDGRFFVRAHGPKSIYEEFLPIIRKGLGGRA